MIAVVIFVQVQHSILSFSQEFYYLILTKNCFSPLMGVDCIVNYHSVISLLNDISRFIYDVLRISLPYKILFPSRSLLTHFLI